MANTFTDLTPDLYKALDVVSRELAGMIPAVSRDSTAERAAINQVVRSFVTPSKTTSSIVPGQLRPNSGDQTIGNRNITISRSEMSDIRWNGEEQLALNTGVGYETVLGHQFEQCMRALVNYIESDLTSLYTKASRAVSPAGTSLFDATGKLADFANVRKVLVDNGAPTNDLHCVIGTTEGAALRSLTQLTNVNEAGDTTLLRQGVLLEPIGGFAVRESAQINNHTAGTAASATTDNAGYSIGDTAITLAAAGTGTLVPGDVITFNGDTNQYVVANTVADVDSGSLVIAEPGLRQAIAASTTAITVVDKPARNMAFARHAIHLATRAPARPKEGDSAVDVMMITDPRTGLTFEVSKYLEYKQVSYEVAIAWGFEVMKPEHLALLVQ